MSADYYDTLYQQRGAAEAFRIAADDARKLRARSPTPRFVILREGEHWAVGRHVATVGAGLGMATPLGIARALLDGDLRVPMYSLVDEHFELITDAAAWVATQEGGQP